MMSPSTGNHSAGNQAGTSTGESPGFPPKAGTELKPIMYVSKDGAQVFSGYFQNTGATKGKCKVQPAEKGVLRCYPDVPHLKPSRYYTNSDCVTRIYLHRDTLAGLAVFYDGGVFDQADSITLSGLLKWGGEMYYKDENDSNVCKKTDREVGSSSFQGSIMYIAWAPALGWNHFPVIEEKIMYN